MQFPSLQIQMQVGGDAFAIFDMFGIIFEIKLVQYLTDLVGSRLMDNDFVVGVKFFFFFFASWCADAIPL